MNRLVGISLIAAAGLAGYAFEPKLRPSIQSALQPAAPIVIVQEEEETPAKPKRTPKPDVATPTPEPVKPVDPAPVAPTPVEPKPEDPKPAEPKPVEPITPAEPAPAEPTPPAEPKPAEPTAPEPAVVTDTSAPAGDVVKAMQASLKAAQIKEFTFEQVIGWKDAGSETIGGQAYQTGLAAYKVETIFGPSNLQAKALIQNGKVVKWVFAKSGLEMK